MSKEFKFEKSFVNTFKGAVVQTNGSGAHLRIDVLLGGQQARIQFGGIEDNPCHQYVRVGDLRELAQVFQEVAGLLEKNGKP